MQSNVKDNKPQIQLLFFHNFLYLLSNAKSPVVLFITDIKQMGVIFYSKMKAEKETTWIL